jgi:hypothetical protein
VATDAIPSTFKLHTIYREYLYRDGPKYLTSFVHACGSTLDVVFPEGGTALFCFIEQGGEFVAARNGLCAIPAYWPVSSGPAW